MNVEGMKQRLRPFHSISPALINAEGSALLAPGIKSSTAPCESEIISKMNCSSKPAYDILRSNLHGSILFG